MKVKAGTRPAQKAIRVEDYKQAIERLEQIEDLDMFAHRAAGFAYLELEQTEKAIDHFEDAVAKGLPTQDLAGDPRLRPLTDNASFLALLALVLFLALGLTACKDSADPPPPPRDTPPPPQRDTQ